MRDSEKAQSIVMSLNQYSIEFKCKIHFFITNDNMSDTIFDLKIIDQKKEERIVVKNATIDKLEGFMQGFCYGTTFSQFKMLYQPDFISIN